MTEDDEGQEGGGGGSFWAKLKLTSFVYGPIESVRFHETVLISIFLCSITSG